MNERTFMLIVVRLLQGTHGELERHENLESHMNLILSYTEVRGPCSPIITN